MLIQRGAPSCKFTFSEVMYGLRPVVRVVGEDERFATSQVAARSHYYHTG